MLKKLLTDKGCLAYSAVQDNPALDLTNRSQSNRASLGRTEDSHPGHAADCS